MTPEEPQQGNGAAEWEDGQMLSDRYRVNECLQRSSTCHLYRVGDVFRDVTHLVLRPSPRTMTEEGGLDWFERFCNSALNTPSHPNLLSCYRLDHDVEVPFLIMDDAGGGTWEHAIRQGQLGDLRKMLDVAIQVGHGLAWLHTYGRVHANLKPSNVLLSEDGIVKVYKYGETDALTRAYASPEQLLGGQTLTGSTDAWSWAASVLHMFIGMVNWSDGSRARRALGLYVRNGPARPGLSLMPRPLVVLLNQCFQADPSDRPASMREVVERLEDVYETATNSAYRHPAGGDDGDGQRENPRSGGRDAQNPVDTPPEPKRFSPKRSDRDDGDRRRLYRN